MEAPGDRRWYRSSYPLQATSKGSVPLPPAKPPTEADKSSSEHGSQNSPDAKAPTPWYRAVTDDKVEQYSITSQRGNDSNPPLRLPAEGIHVINGSSSEASTSESLTRTPSVRDDYHSESDDTGNTSPSFQHPTDQIEASDNSESWTQETCPPKVPAATSSTPYPLTSPLQEGNEKDFGRVPESDHAPRRKRTLRRTPRSRQLNQIASKEAVLSQESLMPPVVEAGNPSSSSSTELAGPEKSTSSRTNPWKRQGYPLQATISGSAIQHPASSSTQEESAPAQEQDFSQPEETEEASTRKASWQRQGYPVQLPTNCSTASCPRSPSLEYESQAEAETSVQEPQKVDQAPNRGKPSRRQAYPLQMPASTANLRGSPTPPSSPERRQDHAGKLPTDYPQQNEPGVTKSKKFRRQVYPLQSPVRSANSKRSPTPPSSASESDSETAHKEPVEHPRENHQAGPLRKVRRCKAYPLQAPASIPALRLPQSSATDGTWKHEDQLSATQYREKELATKVISHWRRQVYPIQSPRDTSAFQRSSTPQPPEQHSRRGPVHLPKNIPAVRDARNHESRGRTIVVCLDGTGDKFDNDNSNIVHLVSALKKDDPNQVSYYQAGIGTYGEGGLSGGVSAALDMAVGSGLGLHVRDAYHFLMHSYKEGDRICIFGFSRGAYTARCLAGMVHKVGLLPPRNIQQIPFAYEFYARDTREGWKQSEDFKKTFCIDVNIHFLGCFDSVASVGFIPRQLPLSSTPTSKSRYFRHAMAIDERRAKFKICRYQTKDWEEIEKSASPATEIANSMLSGSKAQDDAPSRYGDINHPNVTDEEYKELSGNEAQFDTNVLEVWFAGAHADIGGGAVPNDERHKLAQIPLRWMIRQAFECNTGIIFKTKVLAEYGLDVHTLWPKYESLSAPSHGPPPSFLEKYDKALPPRSVRRGKLVPIDRREKGEDFYHLKSHADEDWTPEQVEDFYDALSPLNDQLIDAPNWWLLEFLPVQYKVPIAPGVVSYRIGPNMGQYRGVEDAEPTLHWTVHHRVQQMSYKIGIRTAPNTTWRTVV